MRKNRKRILMWLSISCLWIVLFLIFITGNILQVRQGIGPCMNPVLDDNDYLVVWRLYKPRIGDIVMVAHDDKIWTKRIADIKDNKLWLLGDNANNSYDSRYVGWIDANSLIGKVIYIIKSD